MAQGQGWEPGRARALYNIPHWSEGYVDVGPGGRLQVLPRGPGGPAVDLPALVEELGAAGLPLPVLVRFLDILRHRVDTLCAAFSRAMAAEGYRARYTAVYPIKVNQQRTVVEEILRHGGARVGLEAGSKPELLAVLALSPRDGLVVCNGYKDREYVRLALLGRALGRRVHLVVEKPSELEHVLREARALGVEPLLGVRVRLASIGAGKWQNTGGEKSKFGLTASQVLEAVERLRGEGLLGSLRLLHFHLGSQIAHIRDIQRGMREAARYYAELRRLGVPLATVDVGGGLGVDYEGTRTRSFCSMNYTVQEYANDVVHAFAAVCREQGLPAPDLVTEAGRAMTAHHAVLITDVVDTEPAPDAAGLALPGPEDPPVLQDLGRCLEALVARSPLEAYHDALHALEEAQAQYTHGLLDLAQRAWAERLCYAVCRRVLERLRPDARAHREIRDELEERLADKYFCNFSVFQSMPDVWAIDQIFPIVPLERLDRPPTRRGVIEDLTCDSDGRIDLYVQEGGVGATLPLHPWRPGDPPYRLGFFLVGAYQEILGDMHNLFGDTASVNVLLEEDGSHRLSDPQPGDRVADLLRYVRFEPEALRRAFREQVAAARLPEALRRRCLEELEAGLGGYTYLED